MISKKLVTEFSCYFLSFRLHIYSTVVSFLVNLKWQRLLIFNWKNSSQLVSGFQVSLLQQQRQVFRQYVVITSPQWLLVYGLPLSSMVPKWVVKIILNGRHNWFFRIKHSCRILCSRFLIQTLPAHNLLSRHKICAVVWKKTLSYPSVTLFLSILCLSISSSIYPPYYTLLFPSPPP